MSNRYITKSDVLPRKVREIVEANETVVVSGRPFWHFDVSGGKYLHDRLPISGLLVAVRSVIVQTVPTVGNRHLPPEFLGTYPTLTGVDLQTGDEYCFGIRQELGFEIEPLDIALGGLAQVRS